MPGRRLQWTPCREGETETAKRVNQERAYWLPQEECWRLTSESTTDFWPASKASQEFTATDTKCQAD
jgi:hypothetical protein